ncbi:FxsA family protein [Gemmobacter serpentinus]|uniref:FxsA family protein n=1 Tax=Gemmobacter serpentinus TaxID=2652247 RepID=UPI00124DCA01|nr:FxsA family protein [Gemmobacter serpentinus]
MRLFGPIIVWILAEIALFITIGGRIGLLASLAIILGTGILGAAVLRRTGEKVALDLRAAMNGGGVAPAGGAGLKMLAGLLLIAPGFLGDVIGLVLLIPHVQRAISRNLERRVKSRVDFGVRSRPDVVIDGEFIELDPDHTPPRGKSGWTRE